MLSGSSSRSTSLTLHRGCTCRERTALGAQKLITRIPYTYGEKKRADERTPTAYPCSLWVIGHVLQGLAQEYKSRIFKPVSFLSFARCCTVLRSRWYQSGINFILIFAGYHRPPAASQIQSVEEGGPGLPSIRPFDEAPVHSDVTACAWWSPRPRRPPRGLRLPPPFRCPLLPKLSCAFSRVGGGSRVLIVRWDYVETPLGTARPITQAVDKVQGGSCG
jgi:hypothetical protein